MFTSKQNSTKMFTITSYKSGRVRHNFELNKKKLLVGRAETCDIVIDDPSVSHYHAFITLSEDGGQILDLSSENGIYINNSKTLKGFFSSGDTISLGIVEFHVNEDLEKTLSIVDQDHGIVEKLSSDKINQAIPELPPMGDYTVIDGEYCDIVFDENGYQASETIEAFEKRVDKNSYIDTHEEQEIIPITKKSDSRSVQVTIMSMGNVISVDYLPVKSTTYYISSNDHNKKTVLLNTLNSEDNLPFLKINRDGVTLFKIKDHECYSITHSQKLEIGDNAPIKFNDGDEVMFTYKTVEVHLEYVDTPPHIKATPFFGRDRQTKLQTAKVFSAMMSVLLLLLLVDTKMPEEEKKKVAVIYRVAKKSNNPQKLKVAEKTAEIDKDNGIKKDKQPNPDNKNRFAKMNEKKPQEQKPAKKAPQQQAPKKVEKVAKAAAKPVKTKAKKMKAYKFNMKSSFSSVFNSSNHKEVAKLDRAPGSVSGSAIAAAASATTSDLKAKSSASAANFGSDYKGSYDKSTGAKGLSSKRGIDTTFIEPKTVVLGSMDPEILRKILQEYLPQFRHCYQQELEAVNEDIEGIIDLKFRIGKTGNVSKINVKPKDAKFSQRGTNCMASVLKLIKFPKPKGGGVVDVKQPLNFFSDKEKI